MGKLWTEMAECEYKEYDRLLTEQFVNGFDVEGMISKILKEVLTEYATTRVLLLAKEWGYRRCRSSTL